MTKRLLTFKATVKLNPHPFLAMINVPRCFEAEIDALDSETAERLLREYYVDELGLIDDSVLEISLQPKAGESASPQTLYSQIT